MASDNSGIPVGYSSEPEKYSIVLPCEPSEFRDFVAGLLGRPQVINGLSREPFEISRKDIENLYHLIEQRVFSQNNSSLISFSIKVTYDDGSAVSLNSYQDFLGYNEIKPLVSTGVHLSWILLIRFNDKKAPEKQQIDVGFTVGEIFQSEMVDLIEFPGPIPRIFGNRMYYRISHTNRTWGADIQSLLSNYIKLSAKPLKGARKFVSDHCGKIGFIIGSFILLIFIIVGVYVTGTFVETYLTEAKRLAKLPAEDFKSVSERLDFLINVISSGLWSRYTFYGLAYGLIAIISSIFTSILLANKGHFLKRSFVLLTQKSIDHYSDYSISSGKDWLHYSLYILSSLVLSVAGSILFYFFSKQFNLQ